MEFWMRQPSWRGEVQEAAKGNLSTALETRSKWIPWWQYKSTGKAKKKEMGRQGNTAAEARASADNTLRGSSEEGQTRSKTAGQ